jgi:RNA polymerase sigma factor (sigma-70 family)
VSSHERVSHPTEPFGPLRRGEVVTTLTAERVHRVAAGPEAFARFYTDVFGDLAGYGWSLTGDAHTGDELAQEALTRVYARWALLRDPRPYAYRTVTNLARDRWRSAARETSGLSELIDTRSVPAPDATTLDAVRRLSPPLRDVVLLHYYADLPIDEVARVLRRPVGTVKRRLFDARAALAAALEESR